MIISSWDIYWITRLDYIKATGLVVMVVGVVALVMFATVWKEAHNDCGGDIPIQNRRKIHKILCCVGFVIISGALVGVFTPSVKEMAAILVLPHIINNEEVQKLPGNLVKSANEWVEAIRPNEIRKAIQGDDVDE